MGVIPSLMTPSTRDTCLCHPRCPVPLGARGRGAARAAAARPHGVAGSLERLAGSGAAPGRHPPAELRGPELHLVPAPAPVHPPAGARPPAEPRRDLQGERPLTARPPAGTPLRGRGSRSGPGPSDVARTLILGRAGSCASALGARQGPFPRARGWSPAVAAGGRGGRACPLPCPLRGPCLSPASRASTLG